MTAQLEVVWVARRTRPLCHILSGRTNMAAHLRFAKLILNKPEWRCLAIVHSNMVGENQTE